MASATLRHSELTERLTSIGKGIRVKRKSLKLTQGQLAEKAGISVETVVKIERGDGCQFQSVIALCDSLNLNIVLHGK